MDWVQTGGGKKKESDWWGFSRNCHTVQADATKACVITSMFCLQIYDMVARTPYQLRLLQVDRLYARYIYISTHEISWPFIKQDRKSVV